MRFLFSPLVVVFALILQLEPSLAEDSRARAMVECETKCLNTRDSCIKSHLGMKKSCPDTCVYSMCLSALTHVYKAAYRLIEADRRVEIGDGAVVVGHFSRSCSSVVNRTRSCRASTEVPIDRRKAMRLRFCCRLAIGAARSALQRQRRRPNAVSERDESHDRRQSFLGVPHG